MAGLAGFFEVKLRSLTSQSVKKVYLKKALALGTIIAVIITTYFQNTPESRRAATFTLYQTA